MTFTTHRVATVCHGKEFVVASHYWIGEVFGVPDPNFCVLGGHTEFRRATRRPIKIEDARGMCQEVVLCYLGLSTQQ